MSEQAMRVMEKWRDGINAGDFETVINLYNDGAQLLPTFSSDVRTAPTGVRAYFEDVAKADSVVVQFIDDSVVIETLSDQLTLISGLYDWQIEKESVVEEVKARFSCLIDTEKAAPLLHQHSSVVPGS